SPEAKADPEVIAKIDKIIADDTSSAHVTKEFIEKTIKAAVEGKALPDTRAAEVAKFASAAQQQEQVQTKKEKAEETAEERWRREKSEELARLKKELQEWIVAQRKKQYATTRPVTMVLHCFSLSLFPICLALIDC